MGAVIPSAFLVLAWVLAFIGVAAPGADAAAPFDEQALRWVLFLAGWTGVGGALMHTLFARSTARSIGWETSGFQYEVGFANLAVGLSCVYASQQDSPGAWVVATIAVGCFLALAGAYHVVEIFRDRNFAPGNTVILISDFGVPISLVALLVAVGAL